MALKQKEKPVVCSQINMVKRSSKAISTEKVIFCYIKQFIYLFFPRKEPRIDSNQPHDLPTTRVVILLLQASMLLYYRKRKTLFLPWRMWSLAAKRYAQDRVLQRRIKIKIRLGAKLDIKCERIGGKFSKFFCLHFDVWILWNDYSQNW